MKSSYKAIGDYIIRVERRNRDLTITRLLGLSMTKEFRETTSNIIGTDMSVYRVMSKHQFACDFMSPIRVNKFPVVLKLDDQPNLVSPAYPVFEVKDRNQLDPEYLMMWFRRAEFDRYATFKCDAAIRGGYEWNDLCETLMPIPSIKKQKEIVKEYNIVQKRIDLNKKIIHTLEEIAESIYKQWFIEFEFPDENGNPYKTSGGKMKITELGEIPEGWDFNILGEHLESASKQHSFNVAALIFFNTSDIYNGELLHCNYSPVVDMPGQAKKRIQKNDILYSEIRPANKRFALVREKADDYVVSTKLMVLRLITMKFSILRFYHYLTLNSFIDVLQQSAEGRSGTFPQITFEEDIFNKKIIIASEKIEEKWQSFLESFYSQIHLRKDENKLLRSLNQLLLSKLATIE